MRIVIVGAGFTGIQLAKLLVNGKNNVVIIDNNEETTRHVSNQLDCTVILADGNNLETLEDAGISKADTLVCVTSSDEVNMITCSLVDAVYPKILKIARVRNYAYYVNTAAASKTHAEALSGRHRPLYGIDYMIHPDVEAADAIVQAVENGAVSNVLTFENSDFQIARITVASDSLLAGRRLMDLRGITQIRMLVAYVENEGKTSLPSGSTILTAGCTLGILLEKQDLSAVLELCGSRQKELRKIALIGAGRIGTIIAEKLIEPKKSSIVKMFGERIRRRAQDFVIIDSDEQLAKAASARFPEARVFRADATDENFLTEEGINSFDLAVCVTHNHELNMVLAAYLESIGVKQTVSLVSSSAFSVIAQKLGVDVPIPLRDVVVDSIMSHMRGKAVKEIHTVTNGEFEIIECILPAGSKAEGKTLREISEPGKFLVLLDKRADNDKYEITGGDSVFSVGDHLVLIAQSDYSPRILDFFGNSGE